MHQRLNASHCPKTVVIFLLAVVGLVRIDEAAAALPDLIVNRQKLANTVHLGKATFSSQDCEIVEGCARASGVRRLLIFDVGVINVGKADLRIGNPSDRPDLFHFSPCHGHYHLTGFATYRLLRYDGSLVTRSRKQGFCLRDDRRYLSTGRKSPRYTCDNQGLSAGWQDIYDQSVDCQWMDVTGVPRGNYYLQVHVNPAHLLRESNYGNNYATIPVTIH